VVNNPRRSQLFAQEPSLQEKADLAALFKISAEARQALIESLPPQVARDPRNESEFAHVVPTASMEEPSVLEGAWRALLRFQEQLQRPDNHDDVDAWLSDLGPTLRGFKIDSQTFVSTLNGLMRAMLRTAYAAGVLPVLNAFAATVELRAVQGLTYQSGQDIDSYVPDLVDLVPIVSLAIGVDTGRDLRFQTDLGQLRSLIDRLRATLKDGEALAEIANALRSADEESSAETQEY